MLLALAGSLAIVVATSTVTGATSSTASAPGVTDDSITIDFITSKTGPAASSSQYSDLGCKARRGERQRWRERAQDRLVYKDNQTTQNLLQAQDLVQNDKVYLVIKDSPLAPTS